MIYNECYFLLYSKVNHLYTHIHLLNILSHCGLSQDIENSSLQYSRILLFIHPMCDSLQLLIPNSQSLLPPTPPTRQPLVCSLCLWVCFCFIDKFICHILDSTYNCYHMVFVFLLLTYEVIICFSLTCLSFGRRNGHLRSMSRVREGDLRGSTIQETDLTFLVPFLTLWFCQADIYTIFPYNMRWQYIYCLVFCFLHVLYHKNVFISLNIFLPHY